MLASAPHASHHCGPTCPIRATAPSVRGTAADRYRSLAHRPAPPAGDARARCSSTCWRSCLFESRYEPAAASCREVHVHWGAALDSVRAAGRRIRRRCWRRLGARRHRRRARSLSHREAPIVAACAGDRSSASSATSRATRRRRTVDAVDVRRRRTSPSRSCTCRRRRRRDALRRSLRRRRAAPGARLPLRRAAQRSGRRAGRRRRAASARSPATTSC